MKLKVIDTECKNPYRNLAAEEFLTMSAEEDEVTLFLWQNEHTVVIGKNQNPWRECNVEKIKEDNVYLARRMSGGGAVYHDLGNLNFTFVAKDNLYDIAKQTETILIACGILGIKAERTGRNDLVVDGCKFSGHAYYSTSGFNYHHGTIMMDVDKNDMPKYLKVSKAKLKSKGVESVRSRVTNLKEYMPEMDRAELITELKRALVEAFAREYGRTTNGIIQPEVCELPEIPAELIQKYESEEWRFGTRIPFEKELEHRFEWGEVQVQLEMKGEIIKNCKIYSDAMDTDMFADIEKALIGSKYDAAQIMKIKLPAATTDRGYEVLNFVASKIDE